MNELPWIVVHGGLVWKAALVLFSCIGAALAIRSARREASHASAEARRSLGKARDRIDAADLGQPVTLAGKLAAGGDLCRRFEDGAPAAAAGAAVGDASVQARAHELELELHGATVVIEGPVRILAGSREDHPKRPLAHLGRAVRERVLEAGGLPWFHRAPALRSLEAGDAVVAHGVLRRSEAPSEKRAYRVSAAGFMLTPVPQKGGDVAPIALAYGGTPRLARPVQRVAAGLAFGCAAHFAMFCIGAEIAGRLAPSGSSVGSLIWAATPLRRTTALEDLAAPLRQAGTLDAGQLDRLVALDLLLDSCPTAAADLLDRGRFARAAELAEACGEPATAARAAFEGGDFARSSKDAAASQETRPPGFVDDDPEVALCLARAHLLAGELERAAVEVRRAEQHLRLLSGDVITLGCVADALDARAVGVPSSTKLLAERRGSWTPECALAIADLFEGKQRAEILQPFSEGTLRSRNQTIFNVGSLLLAEVDPGGEGMPVKITTPSPDRVLAVQTGGVDYIVMGLAGTLLDRLTAEPTLSPRAQRLRAVLGASRAVFDVSTAAWDEARRRADLAAIDVETLSPASDSELRGRIFGVLAAVPLRYRTPEPRPAFRGKAVGFPALEAMATMIEQRDATRIEAPALAPLLDAGTKDQLGFALGGSSQALVGSLSAYPPYGPALRLLRPEDAYAGRGALEKWLSSGRVRRPDKCDVKSRLADLGARLSLAQALRSGMEDEILASLTAFRRGLLRRDANVALAIIDSFVVPLSSRP